MKNLSFFGGVAVALILAFCGSVLFAALTPLFSAAWVLRCVISLLMLAYLLYLMRNSGVRTGRVTVFALALVIVAVSLYWQPSLLLYALLHVGLIWLVRCCYYHGSLTGALADMGFCGLGFAAAVWAAERTGMLFPALWCFFLVQALAIPVLQGSGTAARDGEHATFRRAYRSAESALRRMGQGS